MTQPEWSSASDRNKHPILEQLKLLLPPHATVLEIGSGWGQHAIFFCQAMPELSWQPSEVTGVLTELNQRLQTGDIPVIRTPISLDVQKDPWPSEKFDVVYSANTAHIMSWAGVCAMFAGAGECLANDGLFCLYGPFKINGEFTSPGNESFDHDLRSRSPHMGIRDLDALESLAGSHQMKLKQGISMPVNNMLLVFEKNQAKIRND